MKKRPTTKQRVTLADRSPKYKQLKLACLLLDQTEHDFLTQLEDTITAQRRDLRGKDVQIDGKPVTKDRRITKNAVIRCLIDLLAEHQDQLDLENIINEDDLKLRLRKIVSSR